MSKDNAQGRDDLTAFEQAQPDNFWRADPHLRRVVARRAGEQSLAAWQDGFDRFGAACATTIDAAARENNLTANLPLLDRFTAAGERVEAVAHHPSFHAAGREIYGSGIMRALGTPGSNLRALTLFYLSCHNGEAGHNCPLACTAGAIKALLARGSDTLRERYLPRLLSVDYEALAHGAQFLTEVQGGSDVGANALRAQLESEAEGRWRLYGEKWFCSNVTADVILVTARPEGAAEGTKGLGLFLMPRRLPDGRINGFHIRRLKDKIGTRTLPTAELDLDGARAWNVGPIAQGFHSVMNYVINTSRMFNAVGCAGIARRACLVGHGYARAREAFGAPILRYPLVQETLADMRSETAAMVSGTLYTALILDRIERDEASEEDRGFFRTAMNLNKMRTAQSSHEVVLSGIELLAGNATIETFSVLPRLLRDNLVFENWEGSHNVLLLQVLRDCKRKGFHEPFFARLAQQAAGDPRLAQAVADARERFAALLAAEDAVATLQMRELGGRLAWLQWAAAMKDDGTDDALRQHFFDRRLGPPAARDAAYLARVAAIAHEP